MNKMVPYLHHFSHKEWIFHDLPPSSRPWIILAPHWINMFSESEKWTIQQFMRTPALPSHLTPPNLSNALQDQGKATKAYQINKFIRVYGYFQEFGSIQEQKRAKTNPKRIEERWKMWRILCRTIQEPRPGNFHHKFLVLKPHCGESLEKTLAKNSTVALQFTHWLTAWKLKDFCQWILVQSVYIVEKIVPTNEICFAFTKSHTGRMMGFGLTKTLITFVKRMIETMRGWWSSSQLLTEWL